MEGFTAPPVPPHPPALSKCRIKRRPLTSLVIQPKETWTPAMKLLENLFQLKQHGTTVRTELLAGLTTFLTMSYIVFVNPDILSTTGMDPAPCSSPPAWPPRWARW